MAAMRLCAGSFDCDAYVPTPILFKAVFPKCHLPGLLCQAIALSWCGLTMAKACSCRPRVSMLQGTGNGLVCRISPGTEPAWMTSALPVTTNTFFCRSLVSSPV